VQYRGAGETTKAVLDALAAADLVVICPSNPYVSIDPILTLSGVSEAIRNISTVAVSPIVGGRAVKGPLATMIPEIEGREPSAEAVAMHYEGLLDGYAVHPGDGFASAIALLETNILIPSSEDRVVFARKLIEFARSLK
ncbi:MAG: 2-phospho-L-lactate transferase CofD family protein, partial [Polyangiales bacterium]